MANILQVTNPVNTDNRNIQTPQQVGGHPDNERIHNPADPSRVMRADGQEQGKTGDATEQSAYSIIDFDSNYGAFIARLKGSLGLPELLSQLFFEDSASFLVTDQAAVGELIQQLFSFIETDSPEEVLAFLKDQAKAEVKFSGPFFDGLRSLLTNSSSQGLKETITSFLRSFNDYTAGNHLLQQMKTLTDDIGHLMLRQFQDEFQMIVKDMNWTADNGDTAANTMTLNGRLIPFLASYISRTHDYGPVRDAVMLLILNAVNYENGSEEKLLKLFNKLYLSREFEQSYPGDARSDFKGVLDSLAANTRSQGFADVFSALLLKGTDGHAGLENIQQFYNIFNGMLLNESVFLPLLHMLAPFRYQGKDVMSEIWADPDAKRENEEEGRKIKMLLKFDIRGLGRFDMVLTLQDHQVDMRLFVPPSLKDKAETMQADLTDIMKANGLSFKQLLIREKTGELKVEEVFPEIREKERTINVRI